MWPLWAEVRISLPWSKASGSKPIQAQAVGNGERGGDKSKVREGHRDNSHAYLRWRLGDGSPG